jgi:hypothetical protein
MRLLDPVIQAAENIQRNQLDILESLIVLQAIMYLSASKFVGKELILFDGIISNIFSGQTEPNLDYPKLIYAVNEVPKSRNLQVYELFTNKIIKLYETFAMYPSFQIINQKRSVKI